MSEEAVSAELCNLRGLCQAICYLFKKLNVFLHQLNAINNEWSLKLLPVVCCYEWQGWTWMETCKSWANVFKF